MSDPTATAAQHVHFEDDPDTCTMLCSWDYDEPCTVGAT